VAAAVALCCVVSTRVDGRDLSFDERVRAQEAVERVYYTHQIGATKPFEEAVPRAVIEGKVARYLARSAELEAAGQAPISAEMLQRELDRISASTRLPERLREIYSALGDDRVLVAETVARPALIERMAGGVARVDLDDPCTGNNRWQNASLDDVPHPRQFHTAVWTGSVMIVWGGNHSSQTGARYDPATDRWSPTATDGAPEGRFQHSAVWTGSRMIVWGGSTPDAGGSPTYINTGGAYDPVADTWTPTSVVDAPAPRSMHTAVWTGSRMVVWGGRNSGSFFGLSTGGLYDPQTDTWTATTTTEAPFARREHTAVWTGSRMIVWGGRSASEPALDSGGVYDPALDAWSPTTAVDAPVGRTNHVAVWTGSRMIVWGGGNDILGVVEDTGAVYDPVTDAWAATSASGAPSARWNLSAIWTGTRLIVWGGANTSGTTSVGDGAAYDPNGEIWTPLATSGAPLARSLHTAVWTGSEMIVWGGQSTDENANHTGGRYDPAADTWTSTYIGPPGTPSPGSGTVGVWTGSLALVWGLGDGSEGARYDPALDAWSAMSVSGAPAGRFGPTAVWTGSEMVVWGGSTNLGVALDTGGKYEPISDTWTETSLVDAPTGRWSHSAVWTGTRMIVFGGSRNASNCVDRTLDGGARYDPVTNAWEAMSPLPGGRRDSHVAVWTGSRMLVWGGHRQEEVSPPPGQICNDTWQLSMSAYDPSGNTWSVKSLAGAPVGRSGANAVWTGSAMVVWGGYDFGPKNTGGRYDPVADRWRPTSLVGAPSARSGSGAVWTGSHVVVWGGGGNAKEFSTGGIYDPGADTWQPTRSTGAPAERVGHVQLWTGSEVLVWGGRISTANVGSGGRLDFSHLDADADGVADSCDMCPNDAADDTDADGLCADVDNCPLSANPGQANGDSDSFGDACDNCPATPNASQADLDGDGFGDACDNCAAVPSPSQADGDADGRGDDCDNCPATFNAAQRNADGDSIGQLCDNCPYFANPSQADADADGSGDDCDCQPSDPTDRKPAEVYPLAVGKEGTIANLSWDTLPEADAYSVTRGDLSSKGLNQYGPCLANGLSGGSYDDPDVPAPDQGFMYLVQAQNFDCGLGSLGLMWDEQERGNANASACAGIAWGYAVASSESTVVGSVTGTLGDTQLFFDDAYESITEVLSTGGSPASRFSRLEHRWSFTVDAGTRHELHVGGLRSSSADGDDFQFEYSTNGTTFTPVTLTLPLADDDIDWVAALPGSSSGTVTIRVVDTDRTAGHQTLDTVSIDELWIRVVH